MLKRIFDIVFSVAFLFLIAPVLVIVSIAVYYDMGRPVFFRQERPGKHGKTFRMLKFRTMTDAVNAEGVLLPDYDRLTGFGRFLRKASIDEIPEFINVLNGDMSLVGPRPLLSEYLTLYSEEQARRHDVKPGITGWAQVNGRNAISWEEKFQLDVWYVDNQSLWLDLKILYLTVIKVLSRENVDFSQNVTMHKFLGADNNLVHEKDCTRN